MIAGNHLYGNRLRPRVKFKNYQFLLPSRDAFKIFVETISKTLYLQLSIIFNYIITYRAVGKPLKEHSQNPNCTWINNFYKIPWPSLPRSLKFRLIGALILCFAMLCLTMRYTISEMQPNVGGNGKKNNVTADRVKRSNAAALFSYNNQLEDEHKHRSIGVKKRCGKLYNTMMISDPNSPNYIDDQPTNLGNGDSSQLAHVDFAREGIHFSVHDMSPRDFRHFIYDDEHQLVYCYVPKVACTNWKRVLLVLDGKGGPTALDIRPDRTHDRKNFKFLSSLNMTEINKRLNEYLTFLVVRDPLERVLSAFRDKFEMSYSVYFQKVFGTKIIRRYRPNPSTRSLEKGHDVTFEEFVTYLSDMYDRSGLNGLNEHWLPAHGMCHPCAINYDVLGRYETLESDSNYILRTARVISKVQFPPMPGHHVGSRKTEHMITRYLRRLSPKQLQKLRLIYSADNYIFNYTFRSIPIRDLPLEVI